jgi:hypothetical protein
MKKELSMLKTGISFMVIFSFLLTGCGMMREIDNIKADMKLMKEQMKSIKESVDLLTAYVEKNLPEPNRWTKTVGWYMYFKNSGALFRTPFLIWDNIVNGHAWYAGIFL